MPFARHCTPISTLKFPYENYHKATSIRSDSTQLCANIQPVHGFAPSTLLEHPLINPEFETKRDPKSIGAEWMTESSRI